MRNRNLNQNEEGRSMVEMLGVLAVVGLLSVIAVAAFRIALNKAKANAIIHDGRMVWAEALAWQTVPTRNDWIDSQAANESGKSFAVWRDIKDNNYIKVEGVEEEVCEQMLPHQHEGSLLFLTTSFEDLTTCPEGENVIVMAFDGVSGKPAECENQKGCQDLYSDAFYCDGDGHCQECDANISVVNAAGDGCRCNSNMALTCDDGNGNTWCCGQDEYGKERICGDEIGECTESDGTCEYNITAPSETKKANCSYEIIQYETAPNCSYRIYQASADGAVTLEEANRCTGQGEYCYLAYADQSGANLASDSIGYQNQTYLYGYCKKNYDYTTNRSVYFSLEENEPCDEGEYCALGYADEECGNTVADGVGYANNANATPAMIYGACKKPYTYSYECEAANGGFNMTETTGCPAAKYCSLQWQSITETCTAAGNDITGPIYGVCLARDSYNPSCPAN